MNEVVEHRTLVSIETHLLLIEPHGTPDISGSCTVAIVESM
jgi:hypothetical protein